MSLTLLWTLLIICMWSRCPGDMCACNKNSTVPLTPRSQAQHCHWQRGVKYVASNFSKVFSPILSESFTKRLTQFFLILTQLDPRFMGLNIFVLRFKVLKHFLAILKFKKKLLTLRYQWHHWVILSLGRLNIFPPDSVLKMAKLSAINTWRSAKMPKLSTVNAWKCAKINKIVHVKLTTNDKNIQI